jgi:hypothetical protein
MKTVQVLLPDHLHEQIQKNAAESGFDMAAYIQALLSESVVPKVEPISAETPSPSPNPSLSDLVSMIEESESSQRTLPDHPIKHASGGKKGPQSNMSVNIRWDLIGKGKPQMVWMSSAAATLVETIHRLWMGLGEETLVQFASFRVSRGPLLSSSPERDFINRVSGEVYPNYRLPNTRLYVRTHSSTDEKCKELMELLQHLRLPMELLEIQQYRKN